MNWKEIKSNYPLANNYTYLDNARTGAISRKTADCLKAHVDDFMMNGALQREEWLGIQKEARKRVSEILNVGTTDIGFLTDVSSGMSFLATAMKRFSRVLLVEDDFPSVGIPWIRSAYDVKWIAKEADLTISLHKIEEAFKGGIDIFPVSWVQYNSGFKIDLDKLGALCEQYEVKLVVDGTQGFCALPLSLRDSKVHVFMSSCFKWATAGYGVAILYLNPEFAKDIRFEAGGWNSLSDFFGSWEESSNYKHSAEQLELAHPKFANLITLNHALSELQEIGLDHIQQRVHQLSDYLQSRLKEDDHETLSNFSDENSSGIRLIRGNKEQFKYLLSEKIMVTFREDYFRVATHFYNDQEDIDSLVSCLPKPS